MASSITKDMSNAQVYTDYLQDVTDLNRNFLKSINHIVTIKLDIEKSGTDGKALENLFKEEKKAQEELQQAYYKLCDAKSLLSLYADVFRNRPFISSVQADRVANPEKEKQEDKDIIQKNEDRMQKYRDHIQKRKDRMQQLDEEVDAALQKLRAANERAMSRPQ